EVSRFGLLRPRDEQAQVRELAEGYGLPVNPADRVRDLPVGMQQRVEILKTLYRKAKILLLDEPTAVLTPQEVAHFFEVIRALAKRGHTIVLITHKLPEVMAVADRVTVMRRGRVVGGGPVKDTSVRELARLMVGRDLLVSLDRKPAAPGQTVIEVDNLIVFGAGGVPAVLGASLHVREGEILGIAGVNGNGQSELAEAITGMRPVEGGRVSLMGSDVAHLSVGERRVAGMAHIPEDRLTTGLNLETTLDENVVVTRYRERTFSRWGLLVRSAIRRFAATIVERFSI